MREETQLFRTGQYAASLFGFALMMGLSGCAAAPPPPADNPNALAIGCTRSGMNGTARQAASPVTLNFLGSRGQLAGGEVVTISHADGADATTLACSSPVVHMRLVPGAYMAEADLDGVDKTVQFRVTSARQSRNLDLQFPLVVG